MLTPLGNGILFVFHDDTAQGQFYDKTESGIYLGQSHDANTKSPRWAKVLSYGPDCTDEIKKGLNVLIEPMMWTEGIEVDDVEVWKTDESKILAVME